MLAGKKKRTVSTPSTTRPRGRGLPRLVLFHCDSADKGVTLKMTTESETPGYPWATTTGKIPSPDTVPFVLVVRRDKVPGSVSNLFKNLGRGMKGTALQHVWDGADWKGTTSPALLRELACKNLHEFAPLVVDFEHVAGDQVDFSVPAPLAKLPLTLPDLITLHIMVDLPLAVETFSRFTSVGHIGPIASAPLKHQRLLLGAALQRLGLASSEAKFYGDLRDNFDTPLHVFSALVPISKPLELGPAIPAGDAFLWPLSLKVGQRIRRMWDVTQKYSGLMINAPEPVRVLSDGTCEYDVTSDSEPTPCRKKPKVVRGLIFDPRGSDLHTPVLSTMPKTWLSSTAVELITTGVLSAMCKRNPSYIRPHIIYPQFTDELFKWANGTVTETPSVLQACMPVIDGRFTEDVDPANVGKWYFFHTAENSHWTCTVVDFSSRTVEFLCSFGGGGMRFCVGNVKNVLRRIARDVSAFEFVEASWTFKAYDHDLPQQQNTDDCGIYALSWCLMDALGISEAKYRLSERVSDDLRAKMALAMGMNEYDMFLVRTEYSRVDK